MSWNAGYITDVDYTFGYYMDFNPSRIAFALATVGLTAPTIRNACELGFGQGLSTAIHAAAQPGIQWWGTDFNPSQAGFAQDLVAESGSSAKLYDQAFAEFCARDDLPEFEFIVLHGIWSWVSDENHAIIVDFLRRKLAVGGVVYISYNTLPGWSAAAPLRHLLKQHSDVKAAPSVKRTQRIDEAFGFLDQLMATKPVYMLAYPALSERYEKLKGQDRHYLAHEYMNHDWRPMYFSELAERLEPAKLSYAGSALLLEQQDAINLTPDQIKIVAGQTDPVFRETLRDFITAQQFRRDLWMRGPRPNTGLEQAEMLRKFRFLLTTPRADVPLTVKGQQGDVALHEGVYRPLLDFLADHKIRSFAEIETAGQGAGISLPQVASAVAILVGAGHLSIVQDDKAIAKARPATEKLNSVLVHKSRSRWEIGFLASPVTGGGITVDRFEQLLLAARAQGRKTPEEWARGAYEILAAQGQQLSKNGRTLTTAEENIAEIASRAEQLERRLPILRALGVA